MNKKPLVLCILDGCGMREDKDGNAFKNANTPTFDYLWQKFPHAQLEASGRSVGLPEGQMGNSEVGHTNIGAGRIVYQPLEMINESILNKSFFKNKEILNVFNHVKNNNSNLHIIGLLSDGGVHSHIDHLLALIDFCNEENLKNVYFDLFLDGRDTNPKSSLTYLKTLENKIKEVGFGHISTISGRYYAMDRDNNYDRLQKSYDAIVNRVGEIFSTPKDLIQSNWDKKITDEFVIPALIEGGEKILENDGIITFNFRPDRLREMFTAFTNPTKVNLKAEIFSNLKVLTMFPVTDSVLCPHVFNHQRLSNGLGEYLSKNNITQLRIAETEKYAHVTYFFDGGSEKNFPLMNKILIPSPKVATYDLKPEMSALEITDVLLKKLDENRYDVVILNFANGDMVGHTGVYEAAIKSIECVDSCLKKIYQKIQKKDGILILTADHGNCELMWDENNLPVTSHTTNLVPFIVTKENIILENGKLSNIAPTIIDLLGLIKPKEMEEKTLIQKYIKKEN